MPYWIKHTTEELYWHEKDGWVEPDIDFMTEYSDARQKTEALPSEGWWEQRTFRLMYDLPFNLHGATDEWGENITTEQLRAAVIAHIEELDRTGWLRAVIGPNASDPEN